MLPHSSTHVIAKTNVEPAFGILKDVNAIHRDWRKWLRGLDLNQRPSGYEPDELPGCSTPRLEYANADDEIKLKVLLTGTAFREIPKIGSSGRIRAVPYRRFDAIQTQFT